MTKFCLLFAAVVAVAASKATAFVVVPTQQQHYSHHNKNNNNNSRRPTSLYLEIDQNVLMGAGIAVAGLGVGIGLVAFTEAQGERAKERGGGLSEDMSTKITGQLMEDVEVSSVKDLGSLTSQLEAALKESGGTDAEELEMSEEDKKRIAEEADDGW